MGNSYTERAALVEKGRMSAYINVIMDFDPDTVLDEEQVSIMALILENCKAPFMDIHVQQFVLNTISAQQLMPSGRLRSRQILVTIAMMGGLK